MEYKLKALSIYEYGQRKDKDGNPHQEDWIYPALGHINNEKDRFFILCDGMGGHDAGEVASATVCEAMSMSISSALEKGDKFSEKMLLKAIDDAYNLLDERDNDADTQKKMGTTMAFLMLHEEGVTIAHIGDSRVYHIRPNMGNKEDIVFQTVDHSLVNDLLKIGELTPEEAEKYPHKNVITRAMQPHLEHRHKADIITRKDVRPGDYFYLCSDGMLEQTSNDNLCFMLNSNISDEEKRDNLIRMSKYNRDNHSAHLIHILDVQPESEKEETSLSIPPLLPKETEEDEDVVIPEFEESDSIEETASNEDETNILASETDGCEKQDESVKVSLTPSSKSAVVEGGAEAPATFHSLQEKANNGRRCNNLMWKIFACVAISILAICGVFFSKFSEKKVVVPPKVHGVKASKPQGGKSHISSTEKSSTEHKATSQNNKEQGDTTSLPSVETPINGSDQTENQLTNQEPTGLAPQ